MVAPMRKGGTLFVVVLCAMSASVATARGRSLNGARATVQFSGTMTTTWTVPPYEASNDGCFVETRHGSGKQTVVLHMPGHANVSIVDAGRSVAFQLSVADRAGPRKRAIGFPLGQLNRDGAIEDQFSFAKNIVSSECGAPPAPSQQDESGCGGHKVTWDVAPLVTGGRLYPNVATFAPNEAIVNCPFFGVVGKTDANTATMPNSATFHAVSVAAVRRALTPRHGKLIIHGSQTWNSAREGALEVLARTTVTWKLTLIRAS